MSAFAKDYTESIFRAMGHIACIVDRDQVVAASGVSKKELSDKPISPDLETAIANRQTVAINRVGGGKIVAVTNEEDINGYTAQVVSPIIADGEAMKASDVELVALFEPPSETNFGGGLLTGTQSACNAAASAFAEAVKAVAQRPREV